VSEYDELFRGRQLHEVPDRQDVDRALEREPVGDHVEPEPDEVEDESAGWCVMSE
jgi:hypothetical protein